MAILTNLLALVAIICVCLAGAAGAGYLAAHRPDLPPNDKTTSDRIDGRNTES